MTTDTKQNPAGERVEEPEAVCECGHTYRSHNPFNKGCLAVEGGGPMCSCMKFKPVGAFPKDSGHDMASD